MNARAPQLPDYSTLPEDVAANHYGKVSPPDALKYWLNNFRNILDQFIDTPSQDTLNEVASLKEGLRIIAERGWSRNQLQTIEKWWMPDELIADVQELIQDLRRKTPKDTERDQLISDLEKLAVLLRYRFRQSEPGNLRPIFVMVATAVALTLGAHFIPEKKHRVASTQDLHFDVHIPEVDNPEDETDEPYAVNPFPEKIDKSPKKAENKSENNQPKKSALAVADQPAPKAKKPTSPRRPTSPDKEDVSDLNEALAIINTPGRDNGMNTKFNSLLGGDGTGLEIGKGNLGGESGKGLGKNTNRGGAGMMLGTIDTGGGRGRGNMGLGGLDTDTLPLGEQTDLFSRLSEGEKLRRAQKFLSQNGIPMDHTLLKVIKSMINGEDITEEDRNKALKSNQELRDKIRSKGDEPMCKAVIIFLTQYYYAMKGQLW